MRVRVRVSQYVCTLFHMRKDRERGRERERRRTGLLYTHPACMARAPQCIYIYMYICILTYISIHIYLSHLTLRGGVWRGHRNV